jgi:hypothetical protein
MNDSEFPAAIRLRRRGGGAVGGIPARPEGSISHRMIPIEFGLEREHAAARHAPAVRAPAAVSLPVGQASISSSSQVT